MYLSLKGEEEEEEGEEGEEEEEEEEEEGGEEGEEAEDGDEEAAAAELGGHARGKVYIGLQSYRPYSSKPFLVWN